MFGAPGGPLYPCALGAVLFAHSSNTPQLEGGGHLSSIKSFILRFSDLCMPVIWSSWVSQPAEPGAMAP